MDLRTIPQRRFEAALRRHREEMERFPIPKQEGNEPIPCSMYPGYYYIPWADSRVVINHDGEMIKLLTGMPHKFNFNHKGYKLTSLRVNGFYSVYSVHRVVAMIFCKVPERHWDKSYDELEVNHKDGCKVNNNYKNLEWVTTHENMLHMWETGLGKRETPVLARTLEGETLRYNTLFSCARQHHLPHTSLRKHLTSQFAGMIQADGCYFKFDDGSEWPNQLAVVDKAITIGMQCDCVGENVKTGQKLIFSSLVQACDYLGLNVNGLRNYRSREGMDSPYRDWIFYSLSGRPLSRKLRGT